MPAILQWVTDELRNDDDTSGGNPELVELKKRKLEQEIRRLTALATQAEIALAREQGKLVLADVATTEFENVGRVIRAGFQSLAPSLLPIALRLGLPGSAANQFTAETQEHIDGVLAALSKANEADDDVE